MSVYFPHAGYATEDFNGVFDYVRMGLLEAQCRGYKCLLGGDFNADIESGLRGARIRELQEEVGLDVTIDSEHISFEHYWTFRSALGVKRQLDYCFIDASLGIMSNCATDALSLSSDHRGVHSCFKMPGQRSYKYQRRMRAKQIDWTKYSKVISADTFDSLSCLQALEDHLLTTAMDCQIDKSRKEYRAWDR